MRCPGQDRRYWKEDAVFEVPCPECGAAVEIFKDETSGRCPKCRHRFRNPGIDFGCAQWCSLAEECLGFVPDRQLSSSSREGALAGRLIQAVSDELGSDSDRITHALKMYHYAKGFVSQEGGNPRVVLAAALLWEVGMPAAPDSDAEQRAATGKVRHILRQVGADEEAVEQVLGVFTGQRTGGEKDSVERRIVRDADQLAQATRKGSARSADQLADLVDRRLTTEAARQKARTLFHLPNPQIESDPGKRDERNERQ